MVEDNPSPGTEHRFTGLYRPVGIDNPQAERCGAHCDVVGYDLDLERGVPLTFLVRFDDGFETHVFPEEIDGVATFPPAPPRTPARESSAGVELLKTEQARYLLAEILASRVERYRSLLWGDRFDGTPNSDHREGEEGALRAFSDAFGFWVPDGRETEAAALAALEEAHPDSEDVVRFAETLRAGLEWEGMSVRNRTLGVVVQKTEEGTEVFRAGVVWGALPWLAGTGEGATPEEALSKLEACLRRRLGYDPELVVFDTLEDVQTEGRRRLNAEDLLRTLEHACASLPEILAGEQNEPDSHDREAIGSLEEAVLAVRAVAAGLYDAEKRREQSLIQGGRLVCPACGPDYPEAYFTATADALVTAYLSPDGCLTDWKDAYVFGEEFRELQYGSCGRSFGDLSLDELPRSEPEEEKA